MLVFLLVTLVAFLGVVVAGPIAFIIGMVLVAKQGLDRGYKEESLNKVFYLHSKKESFIDADYTTKQ